MHALVENETWDLVNVPKGVKLISCQWIYKVKYNVDVSVIKYKARLVASSTRNRRASPTMRHLHWS